jgi:hypothetical protein
MGKSSLYSALTGWGNDSRAAPVVLLRLAAKAIGWQGIVEDRCSDVEWGAEMQQGTACQSADNELQYYCCTGVLYNSHQALPTYSTPFKKPCPMANSYTSDDKTWTSTLAPVPTTFTLCPLEGKLSIPSSVQFDSQTFCSILIWCMSLSFLNNPCRANQLYHVANFIRKGWLISTTMMTTVGLGSSTFGCINSKSWSTTYHFLMDALTWWWTWWNAIVFNWSC